MIDNPSCWSCRHYRLNSMLPYCSEMSDSFPEKCDKFEYEAGSDEIVKNESADIPTDK